MPPICLQPPISWQGSPQKRSYPQARGSPSSQRPRVACAGYHSVGSLKPTSSAWSTGGFLCPETGSQHMTSNYPTTHGQAQLGCGAAGAQSTHGGCSCDLGCMYCDSGSQQQDPACDCRGKVCLNMCRLMRQPMRRYNRFSLQRCAMRRPTMFLGRWSAKPTYPSAWSAWLVWLCSSRAGEAEVRGQMTGWIGCDLCKGSRRCASPHRHMLQYVANYGRQREGKKQTRKMDLDRGCKLSRDGPAG